jgi:CheY-like chemotaxis protein
MKIFVVEDNKERNGVFWNTLPKIFADCHLVIAEDAKEAKEILSKDKQWDIILLDHDLGGRVFVDSNDDNTGYQVAKFIVENKISYQLAIAHTMNRVGSDNIISVLPDCKRVPFPMLINYLMGVREI